MRETVLKHVLKNAIEFGEANPGIVIKKILATEPELRKDVKALVSEVEKLVKETSSWDEEKKAKELKNWFLPTRAFPTICVK